MADSFINKKFKYTFCNFSLILIGINVLVFILTYVLKVSINGISLTYWLSIVPVFIKHGYVWQFFTYMFVHGSYSHLLFNMYALYMFGMPVERTVGSREFALFYFLTGTLGGVLSWLINISIGNYNLAIMGASGAVYALLFLTSVMYPNARVLLFFFIPMKMPVAVLVFLAMEIFAQVTGTSAGVAHLVHLSSIAIAWVYCLIRFKISPVKVWKSILK